MPGTIPQARAGRPARSIPLAIALVFATAAARPCAAVTDEQFAELVRENRAMRALLEAQQAQIDELRRRLDDAPVAATTPPIDDEPEPPSPVAPRVHDSRLVFSGEASVAWQDGGSDSATPNSEFRVDDAFLRLDAEVARDLYFFAELELSKRTTGDNAFHLGETYVEFENLSRAWGVDRLVNVRIGRTDIPFGEEYLRRDPLTNPLVMNSLADIWGIDEGIVIHGEAGRASYAFAVQNGSNEYLRDFNADKALTLRIGYDPTSRLHLSASAMCTGNLDAVREPWSEVWISGAVFRPIGSEATTVYAADLAQIDVAYAWAHARLAASAGVARYTDDDPLADNTRHFRFHTIEGTLRLDRHWWIASRYSDLSTDGGYPMVGNGAFGKYFFGPFPTESLWRLSLGAGYRINDHAVLKLDYTLERGELADSTELTDRDQMSALVGVGF